MKIRLPSFSKKTALILGFITILLIALVPSYYFYSQYQRSQKLLQNPTEAAKEEAKALIAKVSELIELPANEEPTVATVSDKNKIKDQPFFQKAENGDKVLIFTQWKKAILYRPSTNKIIEVAPINLGQPPESSPSASATASSVKEITVKPIKIALYNGTTTVGLTNIVEKQLKENVNIGSKIEVVAKDNAQKNNYTSALVVDLTGKQKELAQKIASALAGSVGNLPEGETKPVNADILVILAK